MVRHSSYRPSVSWCASRLLSHGEGPGFNTKPSLDPQRLYREQGESMKHHYTQTVDLPEVLLAKLNAMNISEVRFRRDSEFRDRRAGGPHRPAHFHYVDRYDFSEQGNPFVFALDPVNDVAVPGQDTRSLGRTRHEEDPPSFIYRSQNARAIPGKLHVAGDFTKETFGDFNSFPSVVSIRTLLPSFLVFGPGIWLFSILYNEPYKHSLKPF